MELELLEPIFDPKQTALLLCDMQNDFIRSSADAPPHNPPLVATCVRLLEEALDFIPVVVSDACASDTAERHESSLWNISRFIGFVVRSDEVLSLLARGGARS
jgi:nicotinamidase-related amidase